MVKRNPKDTLAWIYTAEATDQFMPERRGLLCLPPSVGITFSLEAIRKRYPGVRPARFHAVAGLVGNPTRDPRAASDMWVFIDGSLKLKRIQLHLEDGPVPVDVEIGPEDRFLTLVSSDRELLLTQHGLVFGDPVLQMTPAAQPAREQSAVLSYVSQQRR